MQKKACTRVATNVCIHRRSKCSSAGARRQLGNDPRLISKACRKLAGRYNAAFTASFNYNLMERLRSGDVESLAELGR